MLETIPASVPGFESLVLWEGEEKIKLSGIAAQERNIKTKISDVKESDTNTC